MLLSVIIVSYNVKCFLEQCLCSVQAALNGIEAEVIIIDNCSADGSIAYLQPFFPHYTFIQNNVNKGFASANNKGLQLATGEYILFLNPDTILSEDTLHQCIAFFAKHPHAGAVGVRMIDGSGTFLPESKRAFPSPSVSFYKLTGLSALFSKSPVFNKYALGFLPENAIHEVDVLAGAFMMIRKCVLDKVGSFDEQFFMYAEDIDLSYRIQQAGYNNYYLGNITIIHFKGESTQKGSLHYVRIFYRAMRLFVKKHYSGAGGWFFSRGLYIGILIRQMIAFLSLPFQSKSLKKDTSICKKACIMAMLPEAETVESIVRKNHPEATIKYMKDMQDSKDGNRANVLIFYIGCGLTYKTAIQFTETCSNIPLLMWSGKGTRSVVGSNNKNATGDVWF